MIGGGAGQSNHSGGNGMPPIIIQDDVVETKTNKSKDDSFVYQGAKAKQNNIFGHVGDSNPYNNNLSDRCIIESSERVRHSHNHSNTRRMAYVGQSQSQPDLLEMRHPKYSGGVYQAQNVNSFMPPTRASHFLKQRVKGNTYKSTSKEGSNGQVTEKIAKEKRAAGNQGAAATTNLHINSSGKIQAKRATDFSFDHEKATSNGCPGEQLEFAGDGQDATKPPAISKDPQPAAPTQQSSHRFTNTSKNWRRAKNQSLQFGKQSGGNRGDGTEVPDGFVEDALEAQDSQRRGTDNLVQNQRSRAEDKEVINF